RSGIAQARSSAARTTRDRAGGGPALEVASVTEQARIWLNGELLDPERAMVSVFDHGMLVGDGIFETVTATNGAPFALTRHPRRLARSAAGLRLPEPAPAAL